MTLAGKTVLVTGATGFLGGPLAQRLAVEGARVRALGRRLERAAHLNANDRIDLIKADITDLEALRVVTEGCDIVIHAAAALRASKANFATMQAANAEGTRNVALAAQAAGVERMVYVSSIAVYGFEYPGDITEDLPHAPGNAAYNITKAGGENALREVAAQDGLDYSIVRPGFIYGPRAPTWTGIMFNVARRRVTPFLGDGGGSAHPIFVDDVVDLLTVAATHPAASGEAFNCAPDPAPTWREYLGAYARLAGRDRWLGLPTFLAGPIGLAVKTVSRPHSNGKDAPEILAWLQRRFSYKMTKARDLLGWEAKVSLEEGVERCAPWLREKGWLR